MNVPTRLPEALQSLPVAIYMPGPEPSVYWGTPMEMVQQMAVEMLDEPTSIRTVVEILTTALVQAGRARMGFLAAEDEELAAMFIYALLDNGISRPMATA